MTNNPLTIYKASAGSGKTYRIALNYIKILIKDPTSARSILAVTFTNKATGEMKQRILSRLYGLWKGLDDDDTIKYKEEIRSEQNYSDGVISLRAGLALKNILYNYNDFQVETIDAFFQTVLRNLARELNLAPNLKIDMNEKQVESNAVDTIIDNLHPGDKVLEWIMDYISENISDEKNWDIIYKIKEFGLNLFKDVYKKRHEEEDKVINDEQGFRDYISLLYGIRSKYEKLLKEPAETFEAILKSEGVGVDDFKSKTGGPCGYFIKLKKGIFDDESLLNKTVKKAIDDPECWVAKNQLKPGNHLLALVKEKILPLMKQSEVNRGNYSMIYKSADTTITNMHQLRLLNAISEEIQRMNSTANRFFLSDTQTLLHGMMKDTDSPFIFEKIGSRISHIMIDEFQDTSLIQWLNFKVLLLECMSHSNSGNLIVGDIKQSIYRWRNGDWRLLYNINKEFNDSKNQLNSKSLDTNYRSEPVIVDFNNAFFKMASEIESKRLADKGIGGAEQIDEAYKDVWQKANKEQNNDGYVNIKLLPAADYKQTAMQLVENTIQEILSSGYDENSIAVILRNNKDIQALADYLSKNMPEVHCVSDDAFRLDSSKAVNIIIDALNMFITPDDKLLIASLAQAYQSVLGNDIPQKSLLSDVNAIRNMLPQAYLDTFNDLRLLPLTDLVDSIYRIFRLDLLAEQSAYVCTFMDYLNDFVSDNGTDIPAFIECWNENIHSKTIQTNETKGIRLITIHKSKGLEFDNIIMPLCDWKLENTGDIIWCEPGIEPFNRLPVVPVSYSRSQMKGTVYEKDYSDEYLQNVMDNLNLLYVGFTRAKRNLYISGKRKNGVNTRTQLIEKTLNELGLIDDSVSEDEAIDVVQGTFCLPKIKGKKELSENVFLRLPSNVSLEIHTCEMSNEFRQSNKSREFIEGDDMPEQNRYIKTGNIMHRIFSMIKTPDDVDDVLESLESEGILYGEGLSKEKIKQMISQRLRNETAADWFSGRWKLYNECSILSVNPSTSELEVRRPDRVMMRDGEVIVVDFKFGRPKPEYNNQVCEYVALLKGMGYNKVKGYLWYVYSNEIDAVKG